MQNISYVRYSPYESGEDVTSAVAECYREVFSDSPWNEWLQCPVCKKYWGVKDKDLLHSLDLKHCDTKLEEFWPREKVRADIFHEITKDTSCWIAKSEEQIVGFCWGYPIGIDDLEKKLGILFASEFVRKITNSRLVAYQDEVGVSSKFRGQKIAKNMIKHRLMDFINQGLLAGVVRTRKFPEPSETYLWYQRIGYITVAEYPRGDGRVIQARSFDGLICLL